MPQLRITTTKKRTCAWCKRIIEAYHPAKINTEDLGRNINTNIYHIKCAKEAKE